MSPYIKVVSASKCIKYQLFIATKDKKHLTVTVLVIEKRFLDNQGRLPFEYGLWQVILPYLPIEPSTLNFFLYTYLQSMEFLFGGSLVRIQVLFDCKAINSRDIAFL